MLGTGLPVLKVIQISPDTNGRKLMFHSYIELNVRDQIVSSLTSKEPTSHLKLVLAMIAFGMGNA